MEKDPSIMPQENLTVSNIIIRSAAMMIIVEQYLEGSITYIELVRWLFNQVTEEDVKEHNEMIGSLEGVEKLASAKWPFAG